MKITFVFRDAAESMKKDIFDIVLIRRLMRQQKWNEAKVKKWNNDQSINKKFWVIERLNAIRAHNCQILLTDKKMNCYCYLYKLNEKFSWLYKKSFSFIYLLIFISWFIEIHLRIEIFVRYEFFFFWESHLRFSLLLRFNLIKIVYSSSNSLIFRRSRKLINFKKLISIEWS